MSVYEWLFLCVVIIAAAMGFMFGFVLGSGRIKALARKQNQIEYPAIKVLDTLHAVTLAASTGDASCAQLAIPPCAQISIGCHQALGPQISNHLEPVSTLLPRYVQR